MKKPSIGSLDAHLKTLLIWCHGQFNMYVSDDGRYDNKCTGELQAGYRTKGFKALLWMAWTPFNQAQLTFQSLSRIVIVHIHQLVHDISPHGVLRPGEHVVA